MIPSLIFWFALGALLFTYLLFPAFLFLISRFRQITVQKFGPGDQLPVVSIIMAAYNEQDVLEEKIESVYRSTYPSDKIEFIAGSDASTDRTNEILERARLKYPSFHPFFFTQRMGKVKIINTLAEQAHGDILVFTDANVIFHPDTLAELVASFKDPHTGLVDSHMQHQGIDESGISRQEHAYIAWEVKIKHLESVVWGCMMGPFGGCFAIRKQLFTPVPDTFLVDDFFINMHVLQQGFYAINSLTSRVTEDVSNDPWVEFRRKTRIAAGNFQNLKYFRHMLLPSRGARALCFFAHKFLRWLGPLWIILLLLSSLLLFRQGVFYQIVFLVISAAIVLTLADFLLRKFGIHIVPLRFLNHFMVSNLALAAGCIQFLKGIHSNVWQPTKRHQSGNRD